MKQAAKMLMIAIVAGSMLSACATFYPQSTDSQQSRDIAVSENPGDGEMGLMSGDPVESTRPVGGSLAYSMDKRDQGRMSKGLDNALGKPAKWTNSRTGVKYTVIPLQKVTISGNPFCRSYSLVADHSGNTQKTSGTACLGSDGAWHPVGG